MKISKYIGADMRQALRIVREQLGVDAVILSSRRVESGVEVTAAWISRRTDRASSVPTP
jgi:flagellar biosynthesis protein FlhF